MRIEIDTGAFAYPDVSLPDVWTVRQKVEAPVLRDIEGAVKRELGRLLADPRLKPGASVAVGSGSRGIANLPLIVRTVVGELRARGCKPFIVPAMGSHGGATPEGQTAVLREYGITEKGVGAPIKATMEVAQVGALEDGYPIYFDCNAHSADATIVVNRIKPHTDFTGPIESGPSKMCAIGLGKQKGASMIHRFGADGLRNVMPKVARFLCDHTNVVGGIALLENPFGQTAEVHGLTSQEMGREPEMELLRRSRKLSPRMPFEQLDVLVIDEMGKEISGSGMDTHVIGRARMPSIPEKDWDGPDVRIVCVLDITDASHGNGAGIGLADMTTRRLVERLDLKATMVNHKTSGEGGVYRASLPVILENADECVKAAVGSCGRGHREEVRLVRIRNTELVERFEVSSAVLEEVRGRQDLEVVDGPHPLRLSGPLAVER